MNSYPDEVIRIIEGFQRDCLKRHFKLTFDADVESKLSEILGDNDRIFNFIERNLEEEFGENYDERFELEAKLKNELLNKVPNITRYEFSPHKRLVNLAQQTFLSVTGIETKDLPYSASLYSNEVNAQINEWPGIDKPIIFFHGGLFVANLLFCKLYAQLVPYDLSGKIYISQAEVVKKIPGVEQRIREFFKCYISSKKTKAPQYELHAIFESRILFELLESVLFFIFSHEVGHYYHEDFKDLTRKTKEQRWNDEYHADLYAINWLLDLYRKKEEPVGFTLIGPIIFYKYLILQENNKPSLEQQETHPPAEDRLKNYYIFIDNLTNEDEKETFTQLFHLEHYISSAILQVFKTVDNS